MISAVVKFLERNEQYLLTDVHYKVYSNGREKHKIVLEGTYGKRLNNYLSDLSELMRFSKIDEKQILNSMYGVPEEYKRTIKDVIFNDPATIIFWKDGTKTIVKCQKGDRFSKETGLAMAICKKFFGNKSNYNDVFKQWIKED